MDCKAFCFTLKWKNVQVGQQIGQQLWRNISSPEKGIINGECHSKEKICQNRILVNSKPVLAEIPKAVDLFFEQMEPLHSLLPIQMISLRKQKAISGSWRHYLDLIQEIWATVRRELNSQGVRMPFGNAPRFSSIRVC